VGDFLFWDRPFALKLPPNSLPFSARNSKPAIEKTLLLQGVRSRAFGAVKIAGHRVLAGRRIYSNCSSQRLKIIRFLRGFAIGATLLIEVDCPKIVGSKTGRLRSARKAKI